MSGPKQNDWLLDYLASGGVTGNRNSHDRAENALWTLLKETPDRYAQLVEIAISRRYEASALLIDALSFLGSGRIRRLAEHVCGEGIEKFDDEIVLHLALQVPDAFGDFVPWNLFDFREWRKHGNPLAPPPSFHLNFGNRCPAKPVGKFRSNHPTWSLPAFRGQLTIGGEMPGRCPVCNEAMVHLATIRALNLQIGISLDQLTMETCPGFHSAVFFRHDEIGRPAYLCDEGHVDYHTPAMGELSIGLAETPARWQRQSWGSRQNLSKLGGLPSWIQYSDIPVAPGTDRPMKLIMQLDSIDCDEISMLWGSGGLLYVFWDDQTRTSCVSMQFT